MNLRTSILSKKKKIKKVKCKHYKLRQCDCINGVCFSFDTSYHAEDIQTERLYTDVRKDRYGNQLMTVEQIIKNKENE